MNEIELIPVEQLKWKDGTHKIYPKKEEPEEDPDEEPEEEE